MGSRRALAFVLVASGCGLDLVGVGTPAAVATPDAEAPPIVVVDDAAVPDAPAASGDAEVDAPAVADATVDAPPTVDAGPCAACPPGTARQLCGATGCIETRRVFVTKGGYNSLFDGVADADGRCTTTARAAGLGGTWRAWFASGSSIPLERFDRPNVPYRLLDGTQVATPTELLPTTTSGIPPRLTHPIDRDETNVVVTDQLEVWTGIDQYGFNRGDCTDWTSTAATVTARVGLLSTNDFRWSDAYSQECNRTGLHLYCFEQ